MRINIFESYNKNSRLALGMLFTVLLIGLSSLTFFKLSYTRKPEIIRPVYNQQVSDIISQGDILGEQTNIVESPKEMFEVTKESYGVIVPNAKYYKSEYKGYELKSCEQISKENNDLVGYFKLYSDTENPKVLTGNILISAKINNFPEVNHYGSGNSLVEPSNNGRAFGTEISPYEPICSVLAKTLGDKQVILTREHRGLINFYSDTEKGNFSYALPKLGSGVACLNLLSSLNPNSPEYTSGEGVPNDYRGFDELFDHAGLTSSTEAIKLAQKVAKTKDLRPSRQYLADLLNNFKGLSELNPNEYKRLKYHVNEPQIEYENVEYCMSENFPGVKYINTNANKPSESVNGFEQIVKNIEININLDDYCSKRDSSEIIYSGQDARTILCNGENTKDGITAVNEVYLKMQIDAPKEAGIPGGLSGFTKLYEHVEINAPAGYRIRVPLIGTKFDGEMKLYDPNRSEKAKLDDILAYSNDPNLASVNTEFRGNIPFSEATGSRANTRSSFEFILPVEYSTLMRAWLYNYSKTNQSNDFDIFKNMNLNPEQ